MNLSLESWTENDYSEFVKMLEAMAEEKYRNFHSALVPNADSSKILGIRIPILREVAKQISRGNARSFLAVSDSNYYEEKIVRGVVTGLVKTRDFDDFIILVENYLPDVDSWAVCDTFCSSVKQVKKYRDEYFDYIERFFDSGDEWKIRVALVSTMNYFLEEKYIDKIFERCDRVDNTPYYVSMANAWLLATAAAKFRERTLAYLEKNSLDDLTFNRTIQKCIESRRIDEKTKCYLRTLKRKRA